MYEDSDSLGKLVILSLINHKKYSKETSALHKELALHAAVSMIFSEITTLLGTYPSSFSVLISTGELSCKGSLFIMSVSWFQF